MCEIYGFCGSVPVRLNKYTNEFWLHSRVHQDGFGYYLHDSDDFYVNPNSAMSCLSYLRKKDFTSKLALCHIRFKTHGPASIENCHPFIKSDIHGVKWSLIHNGFIEDTNYSAALETIQDGSTDSERILLSIVEAVNSIYEHAWIDNKSELAYFIYSIIEQRLNEISLLGKVNLIFTDSRTNNMYVYMNAKSLYYLFTNKGIHVSTTKLSDEDWITVTPNKLHIFNDGERVDF
jgi:glutamine amidotransferase